MHTRLLPLCLGVVALTAAPSFTFAKPVPQNLANGLDKLVENNLIQKGVITAAPVSQTAVATTSAAPKKSGAKTTSSLAPTQTFDTYKASVAKQANKFAQAALSQTTTGKYLVDIMPDGRQAFETFLAALQARFPTLDVQHIDAKYAGHGVLEAYITLDDAPAVAQFSGVRSVILQLRPIHNVGAVTSQGVHLHRINRIDTLYNANAPKNWDGSGMSIGVMSDSFNSQPSEEGGFTTAEADTASGDLPGTGNTVNSQPVVVLQDFSSPPNATNEGRGMCQIVHDIAPKARIGFATADVGEVGFANNIRALGGLPGFTYPDATQQGFKGDVVCDDVSYLDEPMFQDGIVAQGVIDVVNAGVTYCSSAANNWGTDGYSSVFRPVANGNGVTAGTNSALAGTNINLTGVDPALYAGGFHNFNPNGVDVAQTINTASDPQAAVFQWNDPYDTSAPNLIEPPIFEGNGTSTAGSEVSFGPFPFIAGKLYVITENATPSLPTDNFDAIVRITDSHGKVWVDQDTGVDETVFFFAPTTDTFTITVHPFGQQPPVYTQGPFHIKLNNATNVSGITQDFNLLFFDTNGAFIEAISTNNFVNNRPYELWTPDFNSQGFSQVQMVISRSNTTAPAVAADQLKYVFFGNGLTGVGPAEYNNYLTPVTFGHSAAAGANSVAAYAVFRPNLPEDFTSPGPVAIYFDTNNNRLATPQIRLKPDIAAADGENNTFFPLGPGNDYPFDPDTFPNFYGTSAASPHSAAIAALVLQAHGGPGSLTPQQVKTIMQLNTFPHDLDPYFVSGTATATNGGTVSITVSSDNSANTNTGANDPNSWSVGYTGPGFLKSLNFNPEATPQTGGNPTGGNFSGFMPADFMNAALYKYTPGMVFTSTFLTGNLTGLTPSDVTHTRSNPAPLPSNPSPGNTTAHEWTLNLAFPHNNFTAGKVFRFNAGRLQQQDATSPQGMTIANPVFGQPNTYSADILGSGVLIPEYADMPDVQPGMTFNGVISDGTTDYPFSGRLTNKVGKGYSPLDGFGFVNAEAATAATLPAPGVVSRKTHGGAGTFDISLPLNGTAGVECRTPGPNGSYTLVYTFDRPVGNPGTASVQGTGSVAIAPGGGANPSVAGNPNEVVVNLEGVTNKQHLGVTLSNVRDTSGNVFGPVAARMDVLVGDVDANGNVSGSDVNLVKGSVGASVSQGNFRRDVDANGSVSGSDVNIAKSKVGVGF
ncbi:MAG: S8 family serine peptidase [Chthoniobacterales bacterium]